MTKVTTIMAVVVCFSQYASTSLAKTQCFSDRQLLLEARAYKLVLRIDYEQSKIYGSCWLTTSSLSTRPVSHIPIILYPRLRVTSVKNEEGTDLSFSQEVLPVEGSEKMKVRYIDIATRDPIQPGGNKTVRIQYEGHLSGYVDAGFSYLQDHVSKEFTIIRTDCFAYPQIGYPSFKTFYQSIMRFWRKGFDYSVEVTVPEDLVVVNGGKLVGKTQQDGKVTYLYKNTRPAWRIDVCVARYGVFEDKKHALRVYYLTNEKAAAKKVLQAMNRSYDLFASWFGTLKNHEGFAVIEMPQGYGGQADVSCILIERNAFRGELDQIYHEVSHLWNPRPLEESPSRFETEGQASFLQFLVAEKLENKRGALKRGMKKKRREFRNRCRRNPKYKSVPIADYGKEDLTDASYSKGAIAFCVMYRMVGEETFIKILKAFHEKYGDSGATLKDFVNTSKELSEVDLTQFFQEWVYGVKSSDYLLGDMSIEDIVARYRIVK